MNNRFKELAAQANFTEQDIEDMSPGFEEFVELILKECTDIVYDLLEENTGAEVVVRLKEHFGLE